MFFSLKKEVMIILREYRSTGTLYDMCANMFPPLIIVIGLVQVVEMDGDQV